MQRMHRKFWVGALIAASVVLLNTAPALAQDGGVSPESVVIDNLWVLIAGVLVFIMQAGFGMVEAGMTRAKNVGNIMAKNLADVCVGALAFFAVGYGIAYGTDAGSLLGVDTFLLSGAELGFSAEGGLSIFTDFFFQVVFAATAVTIASGAMAERTKMSAYLVFSFFMTALIYPVVVHSFWSGEGLVAAGHRRRQIRRLRRLHDRAQHRRLGGDDGGDLLGTPHRQVRRQRQVANDARTQRGIRGGGRADPRLVRVQSGLGTGRRRCRDAGCGDDDRRHLGPAISTGPSPPARPP